MEENPIDFMVEQREELKAIRERLKKQIQFGYNER